MSGREMLAAAAADERAARRAHYRLRADAAQARRIERRRAAERRRSVREGFAILAGAAALVLGAAGLAGAEREAASVRAPACPAEDTCSIDYRSGTWYLIECGGRACDDPAAPRRAHRIAVPR